jgi:hypothetical protein
VCDGGRIGELISEVLTDDNRAARVRRVHVDILLPHHAGADVDVALGPFEVDQLVADAAGGRGEVLDALELVAEIAELTEQAVRAVREYSSRTFRAVRAMVVSPSLDPRRYSASNVAKCVFIGS